MKKRNFSIGAVCDVGNVRQINQDSILVKIGEDEYGEFGLFVVADGMGGLAAGDVASQMAIESFQSWWDGVLTPRLYVQGSLDINFLSSGLRDVIIAINKKVFDYGNALSKPVGTTLSMLFIYRDIYIIKHIGDSRIYLYNGGIKQLTEDDSWVAQQVRKGNLTKEQARVHPKRNVLVQCIGVTERIDIFESSAEVENGDMFLLCSDGLYNELEEYDISQAMGEFCSGKSEELQLGVTKLLQRVKAKGAGDNISIIAVAQCYEGNKKGVFSRLKGLF